MSICKDEQGVVRIYPKEMYPNDPFIIQRENQLLTFHKDERGYVYLQIENLSLSQKVKQDE